MQPITLRNWKFNLLSNSYESSFDNLPAGILIINGSGFGTKPNSTPDIAEFYAGSVGQLVSAYNPDWIAYSLGGAVISDLDARFTGHKSAYSNPDRGGDFMTNNHFFTPTDTVFVSKWVRVHSYRGTLSGGATKFGRVNSSTASGGGGIYNGEGVHALGGAEPGSWYSSWSGSENLLNNLGYLNSTWYPLNKWVRVEYEIKLNTVDVADGFFNVIVDRYGTDLSGPIMQRKTGYTRTNFQLDSVLLGVESPNQWIYYAPNVLLANTDYTITVDGVVYTYNNPSVPSAAQILVGLSSQLTTASITNRVWNNAEINVRGADAGVVYSSNFTKAPGYGMSEGETFVDIDPEFKRAYIGDADTWAGCTQTEVQPYIAWRDDLIAINPYFGAITGSKYFYLQLEKTVTPTLIGQVVATDGGYEII